MAAYGQSLDPSQLIRIDGQVMAIAFMANAQHLIYRADLVAEAGLAPPTTYEEVLAVGQALRDHGRARGDPVEHALVAVDREHLARDRGAERVAAERVAVHQRAVARETLAIFRDEDVLGGVLRKQQLIARGFARIAALPGVLRTRCFGMIGAADVGAGGYGGRNGWRVYDEALARGACLRPLGDTVYVTPPLNIADAELEQLLAVLHDAIAAALG